MKEENDSDCVFPREWLTFKRGNNTIVSQPFAFCCWFCRHCRNASLPPVWCIQRKLSRTDWSCPTQSSGIVWTDISDLVKIALIRTLLKDLILANISGSCLLKQLHSFFYFQRTYAMFTKRRHFCSWYHAEEGKCSEHRWCDMAMAGRPGPLASL